MKYNLKNRPDSRDDSEIVDDWFGHFEAELREILEDYKNHGELRYSTIEFIKEVLGE